MEVYIKDCERVDDLNRNGYRIIQDPGSFCFGIDAVLLSDFAEIRKNEIVLDLGTGTGIIPILLAAKTKGKKFTGLEIQKDSVDMARRSVVLNGLENRIEIIEGDIRKPDYKPSSFDVITSNPPYIDSGCGIVNGATPKAIARHEIMCCLEDVILCACKLLTPNGRLYMVHRPNRLADIFYLMRENRIEPKKLRLVQPHTGSDPVMVLIEGIKGANRNLKLLSSLIIHKPDGTYTDEVYNIYWS